MNRKCMSIKKHAMTFIEAFGIFLVLIITHSGAYAAYKHYGAWYAYIIGGFISIIFGIAFLFGIALLLDFTLLVFKKIKKR